MNNPKEEYKMIISKMQELEKQLINAKGEEHKNISSILDRLEDDKMVLLKNFSDVLDEANEYQTIDEIYMTSIYEYNINEGKKKPKNNHIKFANKHLSNIGHMNNDEDYFDYLSNTYDNEEYDIVNIMLDELTFNKIKKLLKWLKYTEQNELFDYIIDIYGFEYQ